MKILVCGPKARYDMYRPGFAEDLPVELVFTDPDAVGPPEGFYQSEAKTMEDGDKDA